ncbi:DSD1 family PLP-dependent enzyme [Tenacibaculum sp. 190524A02b]|uniref:DSD1 family PLP-dependent enzyme n=1 Tax=Tenacibaculum vairaonense TaxID=3137860 RepID=A0ABP1FHZ7_9FLAO
MHSETIYFKNIQKQLHNHKRYIPCMLVDVDKLDKNIDILLNNFPKKSDLRIVVKSLPSIDLILYILKKTNTDKLMVFHQPFLTDLIPYLHEKSDVLLGKPMPVKTAAYFYENRSKNENFNPYHQIQWLVDTEIRIQEYINLAKQLNQQIQLNLEIDVGLHRGGFSSIDHLRKALNLIITNNKWVNFSGLMGYDPHVVKIPKILQSPRKSILKANRFYKSCKELIQNEFPNLWHENLTFNGAGSPTVNLHKNEDSPINDIAVGSCFVKPSTFDIPSLKEYKPACFIATPILKKFTNTSIPGIEKFSRFLNLFNSIHKQSYFIYGGYWKADFYYPKTIKQNALYGVSTNQTMINSPKKTLLKVDDFIFLRPQQSEFVFLQFGEILPLKNGKIQPEWQLLKNQ